MLQHNERLPSNENGLRRAIILYLLIIMFCLNNGIISAQETEPFLSSAEMTQLAPTAKIEVRMLTGTDKDSYFLEHGGIGVVKDEQGAHLNFCTASHVVFPYDWRDTFTGHSLNEIDPTKRLTLGFSHYSEPISFMIAEAPSQFREISTPSHTIEENLYNDPAVCVALEPGIEDMLSNLGYLPENIVPEIVQTTPTPGESVLLFGTDKEPHSFEVVEVEDGTASLKSIDEELSSVLQGGDSGTPAYMRDKEGKLIMIGVYITQTIDPVPNHLKITYQIQLFEHLEINSLELHQFRQLP